MVERQSDGGLSEKTAVFLLGCFPYETEAHAFRPWVLSLTHNFGCTLEGMA